MGVRNTCAVLFLLILAVYASEFTPRSDTGEPCEWEDKKGTCVNFWNCYTNAIDAVNGKHPPVCRVEGSEVISCCTSCDLVANISSYVIFKNLGLIEKKTGKKSSDMCLEYQRRFHYPCTSNLPTGYVGKYTDNDKCFKIVVSDMETLVSSGEDAERMEFPHMALLGYGGSIQTADWICGGTVISEWYILTAAHCRHSKSGEVKYVALGILKRSDPRELWQVYEVDSIIQHPGYHPPSKYHDIALIKTKTQISLGKKVLPACLPAGHEKTDKGLATGWGALRHGSNTSDVLQKVFISRFGKDECLKHYKPHRHLKTGYDHTTQMCYGDMEIGRDTCEGDSGGPLHADATCSQVVVGVTLSGHPCGFPGAAGLYTRVEHYVPWKETSGHRGCFITD